MKAQHTKGPWIVSRNQEFTMVYPLNHPEENICEVLGNMDNANLIASAPDLLEACKRAAYIYESSGLTNNAELFRR